MGGADVIRQSLAAGYVDELTIIIAPVILGGGERLTLQRSAVPLCFLHGRPEGVGGGVRPSQLFCRGVLHPRAR